MVMTVSFSAIRKGLSELLRGRENVGGDETTICVHAKFKENVLKCIVTPFFV